MQIYDKMARDIEQHLQHIINVPATNPLYAQMTNLLETVIHARNSRDIQTAIALLQKVSITDLSITQIPPVRTDDQPSGDCDTR